MGDSSEHMNMMFAVIFFAWHIVLSIIINSLVAFVIFKFLKKKEIIDWEFVNQNINSEDLRNNNASERRKHNSEYESLNLSDKSPLLNDEDEETDIFARA